MVTSRSLFEFYGFDHRQILNFFIKIIFCFLTRKPVNSFRSPSKKSGVMPNNVLHKALTTEGNNHYRVLLTEFSVVRVVCSVCLLELIFFVDKIRHFLIDFSWRSKFKLMSVSGSKNGLVGCGMHYTQLVSLPEYNQ